MNVLDNAVTNNKEAFTELIKNIENDLYNIAKSKVQNISDIEDILQETIITIYENIDTLQHKEYFKTWAIRILLNECNKVYNSKNKQILLYNKIITIHDIITKDNSILDLESNLCFRKLLTNFSPVEQNIFILYYQCKYSIKEISLILRINENTIKTKIKRCKDKIKKIYMRGELSNNE